MKKLLISLNDFKHGGIPKCLHSLLTYIDKDKYSIDIICLDQDGPYKNVFCIIDKCNVLRYNRFTRNVCTFSSEISRKNLLQRLTIVTSKIIWKSVRSLLNIDLLQLSIREKAQELSGKYDVCIAYAEGNCAKLIENIDCKHKLIWIHNDYEFVSEAGKDTKFELFNKICCVSESTRKSFINKYPYLADNTTTIYNLINYENIKQLASEKNEDVNFTENCFSIMSIGRISYQKQFIIIPEIAKRIVGKVNFKWYIIGDGPERAKLERKIEKYGLQEIIVLLGKQNNPYKYLAKVNLFALTSIYESYPTVINEALVLNIPIISNDIPSVYEMIDKNQGIIAPIEKWAIILSEITNQKWGGGNVDFEAFNQNVMKKFYELIES